MDATRFPIAFPAFRVRQKRGDRPSASGGIVGRAEDALAAGQLLLGAGDLVLLLEQQAGQVQQLLAAALGEARGQNLPASLRQRLARAGAQLAAERQALGQATASLDRALEVLMPAEPDPSGVYAQSGRALRQRSSGSSLSA